MEIEVNIHNYDYSKVKYEKDNFDNHVDCLSFYPVGTGSDK